MPHFSAHDGRQSERADLRSVPFPAMIYLIDTHSMGLTPGEASRRLFTRAQVAATPMDGWGPSGSRYLRLVFANEPAERLTDLCARFDTALS